jgi:hypothetical protein
VDCTIHKAPQRHEREQTQRVAGRPSSRIIRVLNSANWRFAMRSVLLTVRAALAAPALRAQPAPPSRADSLAWARMTLIAESGRFFES